METKHTPGPWHVGGQAQSLIVYGPNGYAVADAKVFHGKTERAVAEANARLIAAAPELLEFLRAWENEISDGGVLDALGGWQHDFCAEARAAITKATA